MINEELSVLILAGGKSRRMGQDKIWLEVAGMPLVEHVVRRVLPIAAEFLFSANAPARFETLARALPVPACVVVDSYPDAGPLAGLHAGLRAAGHDLLLALAGDMPFVNLALIEYMVGLAAGFDVVIPEVPHRQTGESLKEPLHALYRRSCLPIITARLAAGERQTVGFLSDVRVYTVSPDEIRRFDPEFRSFFNTNTPEDWQAAQRLLSK